MSITLTLNSILKIFVKSVSRITTKKIETKGNEYSKDEQRRSLNVQQRRSEGFRGRVIGSTR